MSVSRSVIPLRIKSVRYISPSVISGSREKGWDSLRLATLVLLSFGNVSTPHNHDIQPQTFCVPEVLLKATWTYSAEIWNLGAMLWELLADTTLFDGRGPRSNKYTRVAHFNVGSDDTASQPTSVAVIGESQQNYILRAVLESSSSSKFQHLIQLEEFNFTPFLHGEDKRFFLEFVRRILQWEPERQSSAKELYIDDNDPWLNFKP
ncbi:hypothetical protein V8E54_002632 [Elaphomyces granulatus]